MTTKFNMTTDDVLKKVDNGDYRASQDIVTLNYLKDNHIEDADMSVNWNRQFVKENNDAYAVQLEARRDENRALVVLERNDCIRAIAYEYDLTVEEADIVYAYLYSEYHSYGLREVLQHADEVVDMVVAIKNLSGI